MLPELVTTSEGTGLKSVQYGNIVAVLVEAIKELFEIFKTDAEETDKEIELLKNEIGGQQEVIEQQKLIIENFDERLQKLEQK